MSENNEIATDAEFADYLLRIRAGDAQAAEELVRRYESLIRREVRLKLHDPSLHRVLDSVDICQSVMASFFVRAAAGEYELNQPLQLLRLLISMARNKVAEAARRQRAQRRDSRRVAGLGVEELDPAGAQSTPSRVAEAKELLNLVRDKLTGEERRLADMRALGHEWNAIAAELGGTADGRRMQLTRALDRVMRELGLEEDELP
jgi:RNA polymerase sigma factor (sigma-70 family)